MDKLYSMGMKLQAKGMVQHNQLKHHLKEAWQKYQDEQAESAGFFTG